MTAGRASPPVRLRVLPPDEEGQALLASRLGLRRVTAQLLINRGLRDPGEASSFLNPSKEGLSPPEGLPGMDQAAERLTRAVGRGEPVVVYGDYDADGVTATAILVRGLRAAGGRVGFHIPNRIADGYGLHAQAVTRIASEGVGLLVAVDCGTNAEAAAEAARGAGMDLLVLDHHEQVGQAAGPAAIVNPKLLLGRQGAVRPAEYCAAGLAYQAWRALASRLELDEDLGDPLALAAIGTVADAVPLRDDNRAIVALGAERLGRSRTPGIRALLQAAGIEGPVGARDISHGIAPRINAAGRLADASTALRLLLSDDPRECEQIAAELNRLNQARRELCDRVAEEAIAKVEAEGAGDRPAIVVANEGWHPGVIGIVASRVAELYHRPAVIVALDGGAGRGSARSIPGLHLVEALGGASAFLRAYGGHAMAAGLTVAREEIDRFREAFTAAVGARISTEQMLPELTIDAEIPLGEVTRELAGEVSRLAPFGQSNSEPLFLTRGLQAHAARTVGSGDHLKLQVGDGLRTVDAIGFRLGGHAELLAFTRAKVDLAYKVDEDRWGGRHSVRMVVEEIVTPGLDPEGVTSEAAPLLDRLFDRADDYLPGEGRVIEEAPSFHTKVVGVTFEGRQSRLPEVAPGGRLQLRRDPANPKDPHAVEVCLPDGRQLGFLRASLAARLAPAMDAGARYLATATALTGGGDRSHGLNILVTRESRPPAPLGAEEAGPRLTPGPDLANRLSAALLSGREPGSLQRRVVDAMGSGRSLAVRLGPGQGLTATAAMAAVALSLAGDGPVAVVIPRPSDVDAWGAVLLPRLREMGLRAAGVHGLVQPGEALALRAAWKMGEIDILLTSEGWARRETSLGGSVVAVLDRLSEEEYRAGGLPKACKGRLRMATGPATAGFLQDVAAEAGLELLRSESPRRPNLRVADHRGVGAPLPGAAGRDGARGKTVVLVGGAEEAVRVAQAMRREAPEAADRLAYYHAGLPGALQRALEGLLAAGRIATLVCGTRLCEVQLPGDIGRILAYGLPRSLFAAADSLGCAGLSGRPATVELRFGPGEMARAEAEVEAAFPSREVLLRCYHGIRSHAGSRQWAIGGALERSLADRGIGGQTLAAAIGVLLEIGAVTPEEDESGPRRYSLAAPGERFDLKESLRYMEGVAERRAWAELKAWALGPIGGIAEELAGQRPEGRRGRATN